MSKVLTALAEAVEASIQSAVGSRFHLTPSDLAAAQQAGTGTLACGPERVFCKVLDVAQSDRLDAEVDGLAAIAATGSFHTPGVLAQGQAAGSAWLVLEWLDLRPIADAAGARRAALALAELHAPRHQGQSFGWHRDNYIGASPQDNASTENWSRFFALSRLKPQFERAADHGLDRALVREGERIIARLPALFLDYRPAPSLVHGDLWHGNLGMLGDGTPATFDPACHFGDRDSDLAMAELFGGLPEAFYASYRSEAPPAEGFEARKLAYTLYHLLNHLNLFGGSYRSACARVIGLLGRELSR
ncbi:MAG: fructosamine kinase family protein [Rhodocyclaceae bacterium]|nr:fructosamine kinase family protein [Rhodocyclaceae bacterium]